MHKLGLLILLTFILSTGFQPASEGEMLWLNTSPNGGYTLLTHYQNWNLDYLRIVSYTPDDLSSATNEIIPGVPVGFLISGCGHFITVAVNVQDNPTVYTSVFEVENNIQCSNNPVYIPVVSRSSP